MVTYRRFRNTDPPHLVRIWNETFTGRGAVESRNTSVLESSVFGKPYFDPAGLIVAEEAGTCLGFVHAAFTASSDEAGLSATDGVICLLGVSPAARRRGIGSELLRHGEAYLQERHARGVQAGCHRPFNPFYLGLYGGSNCPGYLDSDAAAAPFFCQCGYRVAQTITVLQRSLREPVKLLDPRVGALSRRLELRLAAPKVLGSWFQECVFGAVEPVEFYLEEKGTEQRPARTLVWEMQGFGQRWRHPAVGIVDFHVAPGQRRQGLGRYLLVQVLRHLQKEDYFDVAEVQVAEDNAPAVQFFQGLGFEPVDRGKVFVRTLELQ